ncbi:MAG: hypothetical protein KME09_04660 [Pleurocapsa minor HA4230-MV1]|jgi:hypothetical protein|nr:hypothetical protein [Pleurocapsa minor HA4230-MV1]
MVSRAAEKDVAKIKRLVESALSPREKAMYESLLHKAEQQIAKIRDGETATKAEAKKSQSTSQKSQKAVVAAAEIVAPGSKMRESTVKLDKTISSPLQETVTKELPLEKKETSSEVEANAAIFQAIGVIEGIICVTEKSQLTITLGNQKYRLGYTAKSRKRDYAKLLEEISSQGSKIQKISVYPQVNYRSGVPWLLKPGLAPDRISRLKKEGNNFTYEINFNLVSVEKPSLQEKQKIAGIFGDLAVGEFQISGYWQYVKFCDGPGITVMRNYSESLAKQAQKVGQQKASRWLRPNHLPVEWLDSSPKPFKYDPNLEQQGQMPRLFVQTKVKFEPELQKFMVMEELEQARTQAPRYLKAKQKNNDESRT